jgi:hypothetical protein
MPEFDRCDATVIQCVYEGMGHQLPDHGAQDIWTLLHSF